MKTVEELFYEYVKKCNTKQETIEYEKELKQGIQDYIADRKMVEHLNKYANTEKKYQRIVNMKLKVFEHYSFHQLLFYFYNYQQIKTIFSYDAFVQSYIDNEEILDPLEANELYLKLTFCVSGCICLEYMDLEMDLLIAKFERKLNQATHQNIF